MKNKSRVDDILIRLRRVEQELEEELERLLVEKRGEFQYSIRRGKVVFERSIRRLQRSQRVGLWQYFREAPLLYVLSAPVIYGMIVPLFILDVSVTVYQQICFRIYRIPLVRRSDYLVIDRHHLAYLNVIEKLNCVYCGYGNGLIAYAREITARTEQFWCPIKHARRTLDVHHRAERFFDYGDVTAYRQGLQALRRDWSDDVNETTADRSPDTGVRVTQRPAQTDEGKEG